jgi:hypothetical protein
LFDRLVARGAEFDGHLTIMKFTTNWRVGFGTPSDHAEIADMCVGKTFEEAAELALSHPTQWHRDGYERAHPELKHLYDTELRSKEN